jgi:aminoglycoside phosphotransferase (APT) family kinase protein
VPKTYALCDDAEVIGTAFFLMDYVEGRVLWDPTLPELTPAQRTAHYREMNRVIAALHRVDPAAVGLADYGKPGNYLARQIDRWSRQYRASETERIDAMDRLIEWLPVNVPPGEETSIVHGDYRIDNVVFIRAIRASSRCSTGALDARPSTRGLRIPLHDVAHARGRARAGPGRRRFCRAGIPTEHEYVAMYCKSHRPRSHRPLRVLRRLQHVPPGGDPARRDGPCAAGRLPRAPKLSQRDGTRAIAEEGWRQVERMLATRN